LPDLDPSQHIGQIFNCGIGFAEMGHRNYLQSLAARHPRQFQWKNAIAGDQTQAAHSYVENSTCGANISEGKTTGDLFLQLISADPTNRELLTKAVRMLKTVSIIRDRGLLFRAPI